MKKMFTKNIKYIYTISNRKNKLLCSYLNLMSRNQWLVCEPHVTHVVGNAGPNPLLPPGIFQSLPSALIRLTTCYPINPKSTKTT